MKTLSFLTLATLLSISSCSHFNKSCCAKKQQMSCSKEDCKKACCKKETKCKDGSCSKKEKKECKGDSCKKNS